MLVAAVTAAEPATLGIALQHKAVGTEIDTLEHGFLEDLWKSWSWSEVKVSRMSRRKRKLAVAVTVLGRGSRGLIRARIKVGARRRFFLSSILHLLRLFRTSLDLHRGEYSVLHVFFFSFYLYDV